MDVTASPTRAARQVHGGARPSRREREGGSALGAAGREAGGEAGSRWGAAVSRGEGGRLGAWHGGEGSRRWKRESLGPLLEKREFGWVTLFLGVTQMNEWVCIWVRAVGDGLSFRFFPSANDSCISKPGF